MNRTERRSRVAFELWYQAEISTNSAVIAAWRDDAGDGYDDPTVNIAWKAWQAGQNVK